MVEGGIHMESGEKRKKKKDVENGEGKDEYGLKK